MFNLGGGFFSPYNIYNAKTHQRATGGFSVYIGFCRGGLYIILVFGGVRMKMKKLGSLLWASRQGGVIPFWL